jgi:hypothetical protein
MCVSEIWNECGLVEVNVGQAWYIMMEWMMEWIDKIRSLDNGVDCMMRSGENNG